MKEITSAAADTAIRTIHHEGGNLQRTSSRLGITARARQLRRAAQRRSGEPTGT